MNRFQITNYGQTKTIPFQGGGLRFGRHKMVETNDRRVAKIALGLPSVDVVDARSGKTITKLPPMKLGGPPRKPKRITVRETKTETAHTPAKRPGSGGNRSRSTDRRR